MRHETTAAAIMTTTVHTVRPTDSLAKVVALLCRHRISGVPVVGETGYLVGLISERDVLEAMHPDRPELRQHRRRPRRAGGAIESIRASEIMVRDVVTAAPGVDVLRLASLMAVKRIRRIPIVQDGRLVGIVSQGDVYRAIFTHRRPSAEVREAQRSASTEARSPEGSTRPVRVIRPRRVAKEGGQCPSPS